MHQNWLNAHVLHRRPYRETSFIVDFFTAELGRVSAVAKGVRSAKSDRRSLLQPFQALRIQLSGKSDLKNLIQLESAGTMTSLQGVNLYCAFYVNELTNRVLPTGVETPDLYHHYGETLLGLKQNPDSPEQVLRQYELALLQELGVMPDFTLEADTQQAISPHSTYELIPEMGLCAVKVSSSRSFTGAELLALSQGEFDPVSLAAAKRLCRIALKPFLGEKPLKSRELFLASR